MTKQILLYGNSIFLTGLAAQLESCADLHARQQSSHDDPLRLDDIDAVVVDFDETSPADVLDILHVCPNLQVVGINTSRGAVTVLSGQLYLARTMTDVINCLENGKT